MPDDAHYLQLTVLGLLAMPPLYIIKHSHLESLILEHTFDSSIFARGRELCLKHHSERAVSHDLALRVLHISRLSSYAVLDLFAYHLC